MRDITVISLHSLIGEIEKRTMLLMSLFFTGTHRLLLLDDNDFFNFL